MKKQIVWISLLAALFLNGCSKYCYTNSRNVRVYRAIEVDKRLTPKQERAKACPNWRWIALKNKADIDNVCPDVTSINSEWQVRPLFADANDQYSIVKLPPALRPFCVYENSTVGEDLSGMAKNGKVRKIESDCVAIAPVAENTESENTESIATAGRDLESKELWELLQDHFFNQVGQVDLLANSPPSVRLALLDTLPAGLPEQQSHSPHGKTLSRLIRHLVCGKQAESPDYYDQENAPCAVEIAPQLALSMVKFDVEHPIINLENSHNDIGTLDLKTLSDVHHGGSFGSVAGGINDEGVAEAVWKSVERWLADGNREHLVLNLSLAWDGDIFGGLEDSVDKMRLQARALYRALEVANCHGALVVAAAGNRHGGPKENVGPLLPAAWEKRNAPDRQTCLKRLGRDSFPASRAFPDSGSEPLVYAVGGVQTDDSPLATSREGATPLRVAYADHAVVESDTPGAPTATLTGTSVASAVVAATASLVWNCFPELERQELMRMLYESGKELRHKPAANFHHKSHRSTGSQQPGSFPEQKPEVRRIAICSALEHAHKKQRKDHVSKFPGENYLHDCPIKLLEECKMSFPLPPQVPRRLIEARIPPGLVPIQAPTRELEDFDSTVCQANRMISDELPLERPCPSDQQSTTKSRFWRSDTQPDEPGCASCCIGPGQATAAASLLADPANSYSLFIELGPWSGEDLVNGVLDIGDTSLVLNKLRLGTGSDRFAVVNGISGELLEPQDGVPPKIILRFMTPGGSVELPVMRTR